MEIIKNSIIDISNNFIELKKLLDRNDYTVYFDSKKFKFLENNKINVQNLKIIFGSNEIKGSNQLIKFDQMEKEINICLKCNIQTQKNREEEAQKRKNLFWEIIKNNFKFPPNIIYKHVPEPASFFDNYLIWGFCYILLNEVNGLVIAAETSD